VLNNSKKIKNYLTRKNKTDNDDDRENENKINDGEIHIDNWKKFLKE